MNEVVSLVGTSKCLGAGCPVEFAGVDAAYGRDSGWDIRQKGFCGAAWKPGEENS